MGGKNALRLTGFPTPNDMPQDGGYVVFRVPKDNEWAGLILGAAQALSYEYNFYEWGDLTPEEAAEAFRLIVTQAPYETCGCDLPGGKKLIRLNSVGQIQELVDGEWAEPEGDYELPPTPPRTEPTEQDRLCAASANASNALKTFYESVSDSFNESLTTAAAIAALAGIVGATLGSTGFGLALSALITIGELIFGVFYSIMEFIAADLWTEEFNDIMLCVLLSCASEEEDVVHFDYECVLRQLADATSLTLDFSQVRLFGQIAYLLNWIGVQGLDAAGATTAVVDAECPCGCEVTLIETCGYGVVENIGGTRWRITGNFVDTSWAVCIGELDGKCWGYTNWEVISGTPDYSDFLNCIPAGETGFPSGCTGDPDTGHGSDITSWFIASNSGSFVIEFDAFCHDDCS